MRLNLKKLFNLQLFAEGEGGGEAAAAGDSAGAATGSTVADAGSQRLMDLGVPENLAKKHEAIRKKRGITQPVSAQQAAVQTAEAVEEQPTEAQPTAEPTEPETPKRLTWEEIKADPEYQAEYQKEMQKTVNGRLKQSKAAEEMLGKVKPALEVLAGYYKMDGSDLDKMDLDAFVKAVTEDRTYYEDRSVAEGKSVEVVMEEAAQARKARDVREENLRRHYVSLREQETRLRQTYPNFDLNVEMQNPAFARMTAPGSLLTLEQAYNAVHHSEIVAAAQERAKKEAAEALSKSVQAGQARPQEAGRSAAPAPVPTEDVRSKEYRDRIKRQMREAEARGQYVPLQGVRLR